ncbi:MAG: glycerol-3-phosphate dehydrogenase, partial [Gemmatirosa sp.]|nr:glycerol-3-phosphate dehydrogenase [Gemmatirosa sp.]
YLLRSADAFFPEARLRRDDVVAAWAGIRPLAAAYAGAGSTGSASREHLIERDPRGLVTVSGGKLTTYRAMARQVVDAAATLLGTRLPPSPTGRVPLPGGDLPSFDDAVADATRATGDADVARRLVHAHGSAWRAVWARAEREPSLARRIVPELPYVGAELLHAADRELACTLADLLVRRVPIAFETRDNGRAAARAAAPIVAPALGWSPEDTARHLDAYDAEAARLFAIDRD